MSDDRVGLDRLRSAVEEVAREVENHPLPARPRRPLTRWALAGAVAAVALMVWLVGPGPAEPADVEVLVLKVRGRPVQARVVEGKAPSTIIIVPRHGSLAVLPTATIAMSGEVP